MASFKNLLALAARRGALFLGVALAAYVGSLAHAQLSGSATRHTVAYRGYLENASGPITGTVDLAFTLFAAPTGGSALAPSITREGVGLSAGHFAVALDLPPVALAQPELWIEIQVQGGEPLTPRQRLLSQAYAANGAPPGTIVAFAGETAPPGWLLCDGRGYRSQDYPALAAVLDEGVWQPNDGSSCTTTGCDFNVPDLRGRFIRGAHGASLDTDGDRAVGDTQAESLNLDWTHEHGQHSHGTAANHPGNSASLAAFNPPRYSNRRITWGGSDGVAAPQESSSERVPEAGRREGYETRPDNSAASFIIKF